MDEHNKPKVIRGLSGDTETERQEIKQRQFAVRAAWDSDTELRRRVVKNNLGVTAQDIDLAGLIGGMGGR